MGSEAVATTSRELSDRLTRDCDKAIRLLKKLTRGGENPTLTKRALQKCHGIALVSTKTAGLALVAVTKGKGYAIAKLQGPGGEVQWSAPSFVTQTNVGVGLTAGFDRLRTIFLLGDAETLNHFKKSESQFGFELGLVVGKGSEVTVDEVAKQDQALIPYTMAGGALIDITWKAGSMSINKSKNRKVYGAGISASEILEGKVAQPREFQALYDYLNSILRK